MDGAANAQSPAGDLAGAESATQAAAPAHDSRPANDCALAWGWSCRCTNARLLMNAPWAHRDAGSVGSREWLKVHRARESTAPKRKPAWDTAIRHHEVGQHHVVVLVRGARISFHTLRKAPASVKRDQLQTGVGRGNEPALCSGRTPSTAVPLALGWPARTMAAWSSDATDASASNRLICLCLL
jgi:hypothetical protein